MNHGFFEKEKRRAEEKRRWTEWLNSEGQPLLTFGFPDEILQDEDHWIDFCTHGRLHMHPHLVPYSVDIIEEKEAARLLQFLELLQSSGISSKL